MIYHAKPQYPYLLTSHIQRICIYTAAFLITPIWNKKSSPKPGNADLAKCFFILFYLKWWWWWPIESLAGIAGKLPVDAGLGWGCPLLPNLFITFSAAKVHSSVTSGSRLFWGEQCAPQIASAHTGTIWSDIRRSWDELTPPRLRSYSSRPDKNGLTTSSWEFPKWMISSILGSFSNVMVVWRSAVFHVMGILY